MITLRQLRYLASLARHRHFGRATALMPNGGAMVTPAYKGGHRHAELQHDGREKYSPLGRDPTNKTAGLKPGRFASVIARRTRLQRSPMPSAGCGALRARTFSSIRRPTPGSMFFQ
jgi:hypothetical protein